MTMRILVAGILGGIAMFVWTSIAHVALPLGQIGFSTMANEGPTLSAISAATGSKRGLYLFPSVDMNAKNAEAFEAAKLKTEPSGILVYQPPGAPGMTPKTLIHEFLTELVEALIAAALLAQTAIGAYLGRVGFVTLTGIVAALATNVSYWNWYGFPMSYTLANMGIEIVGFLVAGLAIAAWLRPHLH
jgi:hypothetical protein